MPSGRASHAHLHPAGVLFDLDGTLADSFAAIARALDRALREAGLPERGLAWAERHVGRGADVLVREAVSEGADERLVREVGRSYAAYYDAIYLEQTPPAPGAREVLRHTFARTGGRVAVVSNKNLRFTRGWLERCGLVEFVSVISGPESSGARKPDPEAVRPVLRALGVRADEALFVGDMVVDVATGKAAGIPVVTVRGVGAEPAELRAAGALAVLFELRDLPGWLAGNGRGWR